MRLYNQRSKVSSNKVSMLMRFFSAITLTLSLAIVGNVHAGTHCGKCMPTLASCLDACKADTAPPTTPVCDSSCKNAYITCLKHHCSSPSKINKPLI